MAANRRKHKRERSAPTGLDAVNIDLPNFVPYVVSLLMRRLHGVMARALAPLEMNIAEWRVTVCLSRHEKCTLNEVVEFTGLVQSSLSRSIVRMENKGLVRRARHPGDRRFINIRITDRGRRMCRRATTAVQAACDQELQVLSEADRRKFLTTMKKLLANIPPPPTQPDLKEY